MFLKKTTGSPRLPGKAKNRADMAHAVCPRYSVHHVLSKPPGGKAGKGKKSEGMRRPPFFRPSLREKPRSPAPSFRQGASPVGKRSRPRLGRSSTAPDGPGTWRASPPRQPLPILGEKGCPSAPGKQALSPPLLPRELRRARPAPSPPCPAAPMPNRRNARAQGRRIPRIRETLSF